jgi:hypothetical protein
LGEVAKKYGRWFGDFWNGELEKLESTPKGMERNISRKRESERTLQKGLSSVFWEQQ